MIHWAVRRGLEEIHVIKGKNHKDWLLLRTVLFPRALDKLPGNT